MKQPIHVLFDANAMVGNTTGVGVYTERLIASILQKYPEEIQFTGYYFDFLGRGKQTPSIQGVSYIPIRWLPKKLLSLCRRLGFQLPLRLFVPQCMQFDVVLYPDFVALPTPRSLPTCVVVHDMTFLDCPEFVVDANAAFLRRFVPPSIQNSSVVIAISNFTESRIKEHYPHAAVTRVYPAFDTSVPRAGTAKSSDTQPIVFIGTLEPRKNIANLLQGYAALPREIQDKHPLVLAGGRGWKSESIFSALHVAVEQGANILHKGYISNEERSQLYQSAVGVAYVSHYEGFGLQVVEAMQHNKPLLLSDIPVFREIAGEEALYCNPNSVTDITRGLCALIAQQTHTYTALNNFSSDECATTMFELFTRFTKH